MTYKNILASMVGDYWAILPSKLELLMAYVESRENPGDAAALPPNPHAAIPRPAGAGAGGQVAVLPLLGTISKRMGQIEAMSGGTSADKFGEDFDAIANNSNVSAIIIDVDSPGGSVSGIKELSDKIHAARTPGRPIVAVANGMAASAAYWVASAADEVVVTPSGQVGSVGVIAVHQDQTEANKEAGVAYTFLTAGEHKAEGNPHEPLSDGAREYLQSQIDSYYGMFISSLAKNRGTSPSDVRTNYGKGRVLLADEAVKAGMADKVDTLENTIRRFSRRRSANSVASRRRRLDMTGR